MLRIDNIHITQDALRHEEQILGMYEFIKNGGRFNLNRLQEYAEKNNLKGRPQVTGLLRLTGHPDESQNGKLWLRDGHHRIVATSYFRDHLWDDEYYIQDLTYQMMEETNFPIGWYTPFNPLTHVRKAEFCRFRSQAAEIFSQMGQEAAEKYVREHLNDYAVPRTFSHNKITHLADPIRRRFTDILGER